MFVKMIIIYLLIMMIMIYFNDYDLEINCMYKLLRANVVAWYNTALSIDEN